MLHCFTVQVALRSRIKDHGSLDRASSQLEEEDEDEPGRADVDAPQSEYWAACGRHSLCLQESAG